MLSTEGNARRPSRLQLMSWSTPIVSPAGVFIGTTSMDLVR
jgi:hypothetical protein